MAARAFLPAALAALLVAAVLAGCGGSSAEPAAPPAVATEAMDDPLAGAPVTAPAPPEAAPAPPAASTPEPAAAPASVTCTEAVYPSQVPLDGQVHYEELPAGFAYNSTPASQGPHHPQWLIWNWYEVPVPEANKVHNLEHGGIAVQWGDRVDAGTVEQIRQWYADDPNGIVAAPFPENGDRVTIVAWYSDRAGTAEQQYEESTGRVLTCDGFDQDAFDGFKDAYRGNGVEPFPVRLLRPGTDGTGA
ncbi:MAG: DUF3105 domain-containing protein [Thermoleophilia bacterium]